MPTISITTRFNAKHFDTPYSELKQKARQTFVARFGIKPERLEVITSGDPENLGEPIIEPVIAIRLEADITDEQAAAFRAKAE